MTPTEAIAKAMDILPEKILRQHVREDDMPAVYGVIGVAIFAKENDVPFTMLDVLAIDPESFV